MFDIGWSEMVVIAFLTLIVIGPRELPRVMRSVGQWVRKAQSLAREFQRGLDDMAREADLEDAKKLVDAGRSIANPRKMVMDTLDPTGSVEDEARDLQAAMTAKAPDGETAGKAEEIEAQTGDQAGQPSREDGEAEPPGPAGDEAVKATIIKHPVNIAPPHSVTPPPPPGAETKAKPETEPASSDGSQKTA